MCKSLENHLDAFAWSYKEMNGVHPLVCIHHIYIKEYCKPVTQPQRRMNPSLKDIVKEELQKFLDARSFGASAKEKWEVENLCRLSGTEQGHQEGPFPFAFHISSFRWSGKEEVLLLPRWV